MRPMEKLKYIHMKNIHKFLVLGGLRGGGSIFLKLLVPAYDVKMKKSDCHTLFYEVWKGMVLYVHVT